LSLVRVVYGDKLLATSNERTGCWYSPLLITEWGVCVCERDEYSSPPRLHNSLITCLEFSLVAKVCPPSLAVRATVGRSKQPIHATVTYHPLLGFFFFFCFHGSTAPSGPWTPHYRGFTITLIYATIGRTPLEEWSARRREIYLTKNDTYKRQTSMPSAGFEPAIPASERLQTHALDRTATGVIPPSTVTTLLYLRFVLLRVKWIEQRDKCLTRNEDDVSDTRLWSVILPR
jgi:hypothetical protein